jgi:hypothetical protein
VGGLSKGRERELTAVVGDEDGSSGIREWSKTNAAIGLATM